jgi:zinc and cadmium transporter
MNLLTWIVMFSLIGGALSVMLASTLLLVSEKYHVRLAPYLVSFAIGALLGAAFLGLLPHALAAPDTKDYHLIMLVVLMGLLGFFLLEKLLLWRHCHSNHCEAHGLEHNPTDNKPARASMILIGDSLHSAVDGVLIAGAFLTDKHLGIVTGLAIATHEVPQQLSNFVILLQSGLKRPVALFFNLLSSLSAVAGGVLGYLSLQQMQHVLPFVLAVAASSFIYIAVADLIPGLHKRPQLTATVQQLALIGIGVLLIYWGHSTLH